MDKGRSLSQPTITASPQHVKLPTHLQLKQHHRVKSIHLVPRLHQRNVRCSPRQVLVLVGVMHNVVGICKAHTKYLPVRIVHAIAPAKASISLQGSMVQRTILQQPDCTTTMSVSASACGCACHLKSQQTSVPLTTEDASQHQTQQVEPTRLVVMIALHLPSATGNDGGRVGGGGREHDRMTSPGHYDTLKQPPKHHFHCFTRSNTHCLQPALPCAPVLLVGVNWFTASVTERRQWRCSHHFVQRQPPKSP